MVKSDLIKIILENFPELSPEEAEKAINIFFENISQSLIARKTAELRGFGTFYTKKRSARKGRNPRNNAVIDIPEKTVPLFRASKKIIQTLNESKK